MVGMSSRHKGGRGYKSSVGYETDESKKENSRPRNTRSRTKTKFDEVEKLKPKAEKLTKGWKYNPTTQYTEDWTGEQKS